MITLYIIAYERDEPLALAAMRCVRRHLPEAAVVVADDANAPMSQAAADMIRSCGGRYIQTTWPRAGNLNGAKCVRGIMEMMISGAVNDDDMAIKLDADTVLRSDGPVLRMMAAGCDGFGSCLQDRALCGLCYGFKVSALRRMLAAMDDVGVSDDEPEDVAMSRLALAAGVRMHLEMPWAASRPDARWSAYRWPTMPPAERYDQMDVVTLGTVDAPRQRLDMAQMVDLYDQLSGREVRHG